MFKSFLLISIFVSATVNATICGENDDRRLSNDSAIGRVLTETSSSGCTVTMIGRACAVTAGHCEELFEMVEFNVPTSDDNGEIRHPEQRDIYPVTEYFSVYDRREGLDYAVLRLGRNEITRNYPGDIQGSYDVDPYYFSSPGDLIRITGYGVHDDPVMSFAQKTHFGRMHSIHHGSGKFRYSVDTTGGNSGSSIIDELTQTVIGVHTNGGCWEDGGSSNYGTSIAASPEFLDEIEDCLQWEDWNLF